MIVTPPDSYADYVIAVVTKLKKASTSMSVSPLAEKPNNKSLSRSIPETGF
ncbi:hypothetical protein ACG2QI_21850 [Bacillus sp. GM2]|uniref:hypothetical protein n=1 Tax=Bacillus sp. GM2 TaxID=3373599 RepID=UPI003F9258D0